MFLAKGVGPHATSNQWNHTLPGGRSIVWFEVLQVLLERDAECVYIVTDMKGSELRITWDDVIPEMGCYFRDEPKPQPLHWVFSITLPEQTQLFSNHQTWLSVNMVKQGFTVYMYKTLWIRYEAKIATLEDAIHCLFKRCPRDHHKVPSTSSMRWLVGMLSGRWRSLP